MSECTSQAEANNLAVARHQCLHGDEFLRCCVERQSLMGEGHGRTGKRLLLKEGARNVPKRPKDRLAVSSEIRARVLPS